MCRNLFSFIAVMFVAFLIDESFGDASSTGIKSKRVGEHSASQVRGLKSPSRLNSHNFKNSSLDLSMYRARTRLRAQQPVIVQRIGRASREIQHINVQVSNVGAGAASGIDVYVELPGGLSVPLKGPRRLHPGQRALYVLRAKVPILGAGAVRVVCMCEQCWR